jgi:hypothetical protein
LFRVALQALRQFEEEELPRFGPSGVFGAAELAADRAEIRKPFLNVRVRK